MGVPFPEPVKDSTQDSNNLSFWSELEALRNLVLVGKTAAPTTSDDHTTGVDVGAMWVDETNDNVYVCTDNTAGAANWVQIN